MKQKLTNYIKKNGHCGQATHGGCEKAWSYAIYVFNSNIMNSNVNSMNNSQRSGA